MVTTEEKKSFVEGLMTIMLACFVVALLFDRGWKGSALACVVGTIGTMLYVSFGK